MNEEVKQKVMEGLEQITLWVKEAESFTREQVPLVVQEILTYGFYKHTIFLILWCIIFALGLWFLIAGIRTVNGMYKKGRYTEDLEVITWIYVIVGALMTIFGTVNILVRIPMWLKVVLAPRLYVLEYLGDMIS